MSAQKEHREGSENKFRALGIIFLSARNFVPIGISTRLKHDT